jgi:DNA polymerase-3 subunit epsilon
MPELLLFVDTETTGLDPKWGSQCIQVAALVVDGDTLEILQEYNEYIRYDDSRFKWNSHAQAVHGLTKSFLDDKKVYKEVAVDFMEWLADHFGRRQLVLCATNVPFDKKFLTQVADEADADIKFSHRKVDAMDLGYALFGKWRSKDVFPLVGVERNEESHDALEDIKATLEVVRLVRSIGNQVK